MPKALGRSLLRHSFILLLAFVYAGFTTVTALAWSLEGRFLELGFPLGTYSSLLILSAGAVALRRAGRVDLTTACVNVQALGVLGLLAGLALTLRQFSDAAFVPGTSPIDPSLRQAGITFGEGMLGVGIATALAALLQTIENQYRSGAGASPAAPGSGATANTATAEKALEALAGAATELRDIVAEMQASGARFKQLGDAAREAQEALFEVKATATAVGRLLTQLDRFFVHPHSPRSGGTN